MFDPFTSSVYVQGTISQKDNGTFVVKFEKSSAFWDESDIGDIGGNLRITGVDNYEDFSLGQSITAKGKMQARNTFEATTVYSSRFEPLGIDWKFSAIIILGLILALFIFGLVRLFKNLMYLERARLRHRIS